MGKSCFFMSWRKEDELGIREIESPSLVIVLFSLGNV